MSLRAVLEKAELDGVLFPQIPRRTRLPPRRRLYFTKSAQDEVYADGSTVSAVPGARGEIAAAVDKWVRGGWLHGNARGGTFLKRLREPPPDVWEIRVTEPAVHWRLLGRFTEPDTLIISHVHLRSALDPGGPVGWGVAMQMCVEAWEGMAPKLPLFSGNKIGHYVTENADDYRL